MTHFFLPTIVFLIFIYALIKKTDIINSFSAGVKQGIGTIINIFPVLMLISTAICMLRSSGLLLVIEGLLSPVFELVGIPRADITIAILRPISGSGAIAALDNILHIYGADTYIGVVGSVMCASTETTFYTLALYFGGKKISKTGRLIICAVVADITSFILSALTSRFII